MRKDFFNEKTENMIYNRQASTIDKRRKSINPGPFACRIETPKIFRNGKAL